MDAFFFVPSTDPLPDQKKPQFEPKGFFLLAMDMALYPGF
jgi:hypothetical protein